MSNDETIQREQTKWKENKHKKFFKNFLVERHESLDWRKREENAVMPDTVNEKWTSVTEW